MKANKNQLITLLASCLYVVSGGFPVLADDTDIFIGKSVTTASKPNVLLIIDNSKSMWNPPADANGNPQVDNHDNLLNGLTDADRKINVVKKVLNDLLTDPNDTTKANPAYSGFNFAVMDFNHNQSRNDSGGKFVSGFTKLDDTSLSTIKTTINNIQYDYSTPLTETLYEATLFYLGDSPVFGNSATQQTLDVVTKNGKYNPSFDNTCGVNNHIVLLTDGMPRDDTDADNLINQLPNYGALDPMHPTDPHHDIPTCDSNGSRNENQKNSKNTDSSCLPLVSEYLYKHQFQNNMSTSNVITHTIAFDINTPGTLELLNDTATDCKAQQDSPSSNTCTAGTARDYSTLQQSFTDIFAQVNNSTTTFTNAAVAIGSKLYHDNQAYFALFGKLRRVAQQVQQHLPQLGLVGIDKTETFLHVQPQAVAAVPDDR